MSGTSYDFSEGSFYNDRGQAIYTRKYVPQGEFTRVLVFLHGVGEHCSRFHDSFLTLVQQNIAVYALDHQGHGKSDGDRFDCRNIDEFLDDIFALNDIVRKGNAGRPNLKYFVGGISFGGLLAALAAATKPEVWDGLLLFAPAIGVELTWTLWFQSFLSPALEFLIPAWEIVPAVNPSLLSRNEKFVQDYVEDPLVAHNPLRVRMAMNIFRGMDRLATIRHKISMPVLLFHGDADKVTSPAISRQFFDALPATDKTYTSLEGHYHCLFNEPERASFLVSIIDWIQNK